MGEFISTPRYKSNSEPKKWFFFFFFFFFNKDLSIIVCLNLREIRQMIMRDYL